MFGDAGFECCIWHNLPQIITQSSQISLQYHRHCPPMDLQLLNQQITVSINMWWGGKCGWVQQKASGTGHPTWQLLGSILFNLFISPLGGICQAHEISFVGYADDTQNYMRFRPLTNSLEPQLTCISKLESCLADVRSWMQINFLKLNESKTEFITFGTRQLSKVGMINIRIGDDVIQNAPSVRSLGLHFNEELKYSSHVNKLTSVPFNMIHNVARNCHQLDIEMTKC